MAWNSSKSPGDTWYSADYNTLVDVLEAISGSYYGHSANTLIHFTKLSGLTDVSSQTPSSGQSLVWDGSIWKPNTVSGQTAGNLSDLTVDTNKNWSSYGIYGLSYVSSNIISSATILNHLPSSQLKTWFDSEYAPSGLNTQDWSGASDFLAHTSDSTLHFTKASLDDDYYPSSVGNSLSTSYTGHSGNSERHRRLITGYSNVSDGGNIAHGLGVKPSYISVVPSGNSYYYGIVCTADATNITVNFTIPGSKDVNWMVEV